MGEFELTIEEVEAELASIRETPVPVGDDPFWQDERERFLFSLLEQLRDKARK